MALVSEWQAETILRNLGRFSNEVSYQLGVFLLQNRREGEFDDICQGAEEFFANLSKPGKAMSDSGAEYGVLQFSQSSDAIQMIYAVSQPTQTPESNSWQKLAGVVKKIRQAREIDEVRDDVVAARDWFYALSRMVRETLRTGESVVEA